MKPIAEFLSRHPPFEGVGDAELERIATDVEVEYYAAERGRLPPGGGADAPRPGRPYRCGRAGRPRAGARPARRGRAVRASVDARRAADRVRGSGRRRRALCYRLPAEDVVPLLGRPAGLRYLARTLLARPRPDAAALPAGHDPNHQQHRPQLVRDRPVVCEPSASVREAARSMAEAGASSALVSARRWALRDPHRPRPARARRRRRSAHRRAGRRRR